LIDRNQAGFRAEDYRDKAFSFENRIVDQFTHQAQLTRGKGKSTSIILALLFLLLLIGATGCAWFARSKQVESPEKLAEKGMEAFGEEDYKDALKAFNTLKERYPYSQYAILAELKVADAHFYREEYPEAIGAYEDFVQLHPKNEAIPYVKYQIALCYFKQMLSKDRDQTPTRMAILSFERLLREHAESAYASEARKKINDCRKLLAEHDLYVGRFYYNSEYYKAALGRFEGVLTGYVDVLPPQTQREVERLITACTAKLSDRIGDEADDHH
jgi:outer membrane protein assembly factor BamD